ncbi:MAG: UbiA family prenyltransferase [Tabrizicola sp.]|nr:UbiA family prenyltransferase [Tabrizicola sp.]
MTTAVPASDSRRALQVARDFVAELRPHQWVKNLLVFISPLAAHVMFQPGMLVHLGLLFAAFCAAASGVYVANDLLDLKSDRAHPRKRNRPFASGRLPVAFGAAGPLLMQTARDHEARILPVDSEHSAIFQALNAERLDTVERIILTASGGALRDWPLDALIHATVNEAMAHPNWAMGQRITIDSASMFNKALEVIETREFFDVEPDRIEVILHPESLIHSMVGFHDGAIMAHLGAADMRHSIGYALNWPARSELPVARLDFAQIATLTFRAPDLNRYPALRLCRDVMATRGLAGAAFNAAKEKALDHFLHGGIGFMQMAEVVEETMTRLDREVFLANSALTLEDILATDHLARMRADESARDMTRKR